MAFLVLVSWTLSQRTPNGASPQPRVDPCRLIGRRARPLTSASISWIAKARQGRFPPGSVFADPSFDGEAARSEALIRLRGLADHFEKEDPAMHKTNTVDYAVVYEGEIWLELDDAKTIHLKRGDVVVQNGTRHAWRNKGTTPVTMLFFLNGAKE
jgi:mannose-6-phosphate isomerase-like protein (cupin superfamily)